MAKEAVKLREKVLKSGVKSLYLDIYQNGQRKYEFLKLYINPPKDSTTKLINKATLEAARVIQAKRILEIQSHGIDSIAPRQKNIKFKDFAFDEYIQNHDLTDSSIIRLSSGIKRFLYFTGEDIMIQSITPELLRNYYKSLKSSEDGKNTPKKRTFKPNTQREYFGIISAILNYAVKRDIINTNPVRKLDIREKPQRVEVNKCYLSLEEVNTLAKTDCNSEIVKNMFLFACFTGLRISDILDLKWRDITDDIINIKMKKTQRLVQIPIGNNAFNFLPQRDTSDNDNVFPCELSRPSISYILRKWTKKAGINKSITFHTSRHTFATLSLEYGADIYTVSNLLGHTELRTTQIYAKIVDKKKKEAVNLIPKLED